ncbi:hypothetical protein CEP52_017532 [Fusarium oligoseptatum]|uniref:Secreted protein n=1 Tax=Fusarium oligoseptatum TaxID=2604345 RepID=A0A428RPH1_9HYPO|nr:hypothetical protein CEP52_017532 [Fusarium oligoseptatum]
MCTLTFFLAATVWHCAPGRPLRQSYTVLLPSRRINSVWACIVFKVDVCANYLAIRRDSASKLPELPYNSRQVD